MITRLQALGSPGASDIENSVGTPAKLNANEDASSRTLTVHSVEQRGGNSQTKRVAGNNILPSDGWDSNLPGDEKPTKPADADMTWSQFPFRPVQQLPRNQDRAQIYHRDGFVYLNDRQRPFGYVDGIADLFASQALGDFYYAKAKKAMPVPMSPDTKKDTQIKWLASLGPSDIAQFNFKPPGKNDIPEEFRAVTMGSEKLRKLGEKDESPIVSLDANAPSDKDPISQLPPVEDEYTPPTASAISWNFDEARFPLLLRKLLDMSEIEGQNKDHAAALKIAVCNGWAYLSAATSFHYLKQQYDIMFKV